MTGWVFHLSEPWFSHLQIPPGKTLSELTEIILSFTHSFIFCILSTYYVFDTRLGAGDTAVTKTLAVTEEAMWSEQLRTWTLEPDGLGVSLAYHLMTV